MTLYDLPRSYSYSYNISLIKEPRWAVSQTEKMKNNSYYHSMQNVLPFHWPKARHVTGKQWSAHAQCRLTVFGLSVWLQIMFYSCDLSCVRNGRSPRFPKIFIKKQTWFRMIKQLLIPWFVSVSQINYFFQSSASANNWSRFWQIVIFFSTLPIIVNYFSMQKAAGHRR